MLAFEQLEPRLPTYSLLGEGWGISQGPVTISFIPAGIEWSVHGVTAAASPLLVNSIAEAAEQIAAVDGPGGLEFEVVPDDGTLFYQVGKSQGDPRFGDIRIAQIDLPENYTRPWRALPPFPTGTSGGDIFIDLDQVQHGMRKVARQFYGLSTEAAIDRLALGLMLRSVGVGESGDRRSVTRDPWEWKQTLARYEAIQELTDDDVAGINALYGKPEVGSKNAELAESVVPTSEFPLPTSRSYPTAPPVTINGVKMFI